MPLSPEQRRYLVFEEEHPRMTGRKPAEVRHEFGHGIARYFQVLYSLIDMPAAEREFPQLVHRVQRIRNAQSSARRERRIG